jgi:hypothetical protein
MSCDQEIHTETSTNPYFAPQRNGSAVCVTQGRVSRCVTALHSTTKYSEDLPLCSWHNHHAITRTRAPKPSVPGSAICIASRTHTSCDGMRCVAQLSQHLRVYVVRVLCAFQTLHQPGHVALFADMTIDMSHCCASCCLDLAM